METYNSSFSMNLSDRLHLFEDLLRCDTNLRVYQYDLSGSVVYANDENAEQQKWLFNAFGGKTGVLENLGNTCNPRIAGGDYGLFWASAYLENETGACNVYVIGPIMLRGLSQKEEKEILYRYKKEISVNAHTGKVCTDAEKMQDALRKIPVIPYNDLAKYTVMLHYCLTGKKIELAEIEITHREEQRFTVEYEDEGMRTSYYLENAMLQMIRSGNLDYHNVIEEAMRKVYMSPLKEVDSLRQIKNLAIVYIGLFARAAIEGGVLIETAFRMAGEYQIKVERCKTVTEIISLNYTMYADYLGKVHEHQMKKGMSPVVCSICDYVETNLDHVLNAKELATRFGYAEYYLTRKFRQETGISLSDYILQKRINQAKIWLSTTEMSITDIALRLQFRNRSYFGVNFKKQTGFSPAEYRNNKKII